MDRYIELLIEELNKISLKMNSSNETVLESADEDESFLKHIENVENYLYGDKIPVSSITGILFEQLPPPERLNKRQQKILAAELEKFLLYFHFELDFPRKYPLHLRYPFIRNFWNEKHVALSFGSSHVEFCSYEKENCPFPGYCNICDEVEEQMKDDKKQNNKNKDEFNLDELPF